MASLQVLILLVYLTFMIYIMWKMREEVLQDKQKKDDEKLDNKIFLEPDTGALNSLLGEQLARLNLRLKDDIDIDVGKGSVKELSKLNSLSLTIKNNTYNYVALIDWSGSYLSNLSGNPRPILYMGALGRGATSVPPTRAFKGNLQLLPQNAAEGTGGSPSLVKADALLESLEDGKECFIYLWISVQLKLVVAASTTAIISVSCPYKLRTPTQAEVQEWEKGNKKRAAAKKAKEAQKKKEEQEAEDRKLPWFRRL